MDESPATKSYGTWESPISAESLASADISIQQIAASGNSLEAGASYGQFYYIEQRPSEDGRRCIVECSFSSDVRPKLRDVLPKRYDAHTKAHEYGGGAFTLQYAGRLIFSDSKTQGVFSLDPKTTEVEEIIAGNAQISYADFDASDLQGQRFVVAVRENRQQKEAVNEIVALDLLQKTVTSVRSGADFYAHPRLYTNENGESRISWIEWYHPDMPWTGSQLHVADFSLDSACHKPVLSNVICVAGTPGRVSIAQPRWNVFSGSLVFCSDQTGYWQIYTYDPDGGCGAQLLHFGNLADGNFAAPEWQFGNSSFAFVDATTMAAIWTKDAVSHLIKIDLSSGTSEICQYSSLDCKVPSIRAVSKSRVVFVASTPTQATTLFSIDIENFQAPWTILKASSTLHISPSYFSKAETISFSRSMKHPEELAHAIFNPPWNPSFQAPPETCPPLIVIMHGGPTDAVSTGLSMVRQYWTSRGYALAAVNYAGSSGYSRDYRHRLDGQWGLAEVLDAAACVEYLKSIQRIDPSRVGIVGSSAGGYSCLQALCHYAHVWAAGISLYGISDVKALIEETHKFESQYADRLLFGVVSDDISNDPTTAADERARIVHDRSPLYHAENITAPLLLLQGTEDKVVPPKQARGMMEVMQRRSAAATEVRLVFLEGEGHGFIKGENVQRALQEQEAWWRRYLVRS